MNKNDFYYNLPESLIAQAPLMRRDSSRLLCLERTSGAIEHRAFYELPGLLRKGDCLVLNDSRVLPARLFGIRDTGGGDVSSHNASASSLSNEAAAKEIVSLEAVESGTKSNRKNIEVLLLKKYDPSATTAPASTATLSDWECLVRPGRKIKVGAKLSFGGGLTAAVIAELPGGNRLIRFYCAGNFLEILSKLGNMPLPPYIHRELKDAERYQTVYAREPGSAAAPTAGLHFTHDLFDKLRSKGIETCHVTLHIGLGTFRPVKTEKIEDHQMHCEHYIISEQTANKINAAKKSGNRVIAVGTTACRVLETLCDKNGYITSGEGSTDIFIYPGYEFRCIDGLITNFHLPESTLIMLVSAFAGREKTLHAYGEAISHKYRFYSFGDAMLIV
ncbi:MAG: tRNA preQ1(34) S-adenosylmethionine ribosyltransferase-isomerase QueA [Oscillospiraceae bacterium]|nr:tRNA preQ1(34) S-adenosylmethionine ribosyltransferase-isomerase QueA [Oscillospiraceae bacterium]